VYQITVYMFCVFVKVRVVCNASSWLIVPIDATEQMFVCDVKILKDAIDPLQFRSCRGEHPICIMF